MKEKTGAEMNATATRTDVHRPSFLDPADYVEVGWFDNHPEQGASWRDHDLIGDASEFPGNYVTRGRCDHCGAGPLRYGVEFLHKPSNQTVVVGLACANVLGLSSMSEKTLRKQVEYRWRLNKRDAWRAADPDHERVYDFLFRMLENGNYGYGGFYHSLMHKLNRYGELTEKQVAAALRAEEREAGFAERREAEAAALAEAGPVVEGKQTIEGEVLTTKWQEGMYGDVFKMLVKLDNGNKVWGTVPSALADVTAGSHDDEGNWQEPEHETLKGLRVRFTATVERSRDDEHFGFFKRPTKAEVIAS